MDPFIILFEKKVWVFMVVGDQKGTLLGFFFSFVGQKQYVVHLRVVLFFNVPSIPTINLC